MNIGIIYAKSLNNVIGSRGKLPWHLPEDLAHFKSTTKDACVAMGRKTWQTLPIKPLPDRTNIVLTSRKLSIDGVIRSRTIEEAINEAFYRRKDIWFIGGSNVIKRSLPYANRVIVTEILNTYEGDVIVEDLPDDWKEISKVSKTSTNGISFNVITYERV